MHDCPCTDRHGQLSMPMKADDLEGSLGPVFAPPTSLDILHNVAALKELAIERNDVLKDINRILYAIAFCAVLLTTAAIGRLAGWW